MIETLLITFREGLEAFLIVSIMLAFVTRTGRENLKKPIYGGIITALIISATTGWHIANLAQEPVWEGSLALIAGALVASFTWYIMKNAKNIRGDIHSRMERSVTESNAGEQAGAEIGIFLITILMVAREGMETALMLGTISAQNNAADMWIGALLGLGAITIIAALWASQSHKINIKAFMQVTGAFLILFAIHLFMYGIHELSEMASIPLIGEEANTFIHIHTEVIESPWFENLVTAGLILVPTAWLGYSFIKDKMNSKSRQQVAAE